MSTMLSEAPLWKEPNLHIPQELTDQKISKARYFTVQLKIIVEGNFSGEHKLQRQGRTPQKSGPEAVFIHIPYS